MKVRLNTNSVGKEVKDFHQQMSSNVIGQPRSVRAMTNAFQSYLAQITDRRKPISSMLFLGPTGVGKTHVVEAAAEILLGEPTSVVKIDCAEFAEKHAIAKLIGSPPGYVGYERNTALRQDNLDAYQTKEHKLNFLLFDEVEKGHQTLTNLLLGAMDKGIITMSDGDETYLSDTILVMTSNLGAQEMKSNISKEIGFSRGNPNDFTRQQQQGLDQKNYEAATRAAKKYFSPEFYNRIDKVVVFQSLNQTDLKKILNILIADVNELVTKREDFSFSIAVSDEAKQRILEEGYKPQFGARELKRALRRYVVNPLSSLVVSKQIRHGDLIYVDYEARSGKMVFDKETNAMMYASVEDFD